MSFVSIIIPVYNTKDYLSRCIESVLNQSYFDFELLLVDDGSTDGSGEICDSYSKKDSRVRVFHKENGGVSSARNYGLDQASGEWVYFVDSDDELLPGGLQVLVDSVDDDIDIVMGGYEKCELNGEVVKYYTGVIRHIKMDKKESIKTLYQKYSYYYPYLGWMCLRMFRNSVIKRENLRFDIDLRIKEDTLFTAKYICRSNGITCFVTTSVYAYYMREDSAMGAWRRGFDYKYLDSLSALAKIKNEINRFFPSFSESVFIAKEGIWGRYKEILSRMKLNGIEDEDIRKTMKTIIKKEMGVIPFFLIRKKIRNLKRKWCR